MFCNFYVNNKLVFTESSTRLIQSISHDVRGLCHLFIFFVNALLLQTYYSNSARQKIQLLKYSLANSVKGQKKWIFANQPNVHSMRVSRKKSRGCGKHVERFSVCEIFLIQFSLQSYWLPLGGTYLVSQCSH